MKEKKQLLDAYHQGTLTNKESLQLEQWIANGDISLNEIEEYDLTMRYMEATTKVATSTEMDARFHAMLSAEQTKLNPGSTWFNWIPAPLRLAIPLALMILCFYIGFNWNTSSTSLVDNNGLQTHQDLTTTLLISEDISEKINVVCSAKKVDTVDTKIIEVLLYTLNNDESSNVRLACIDVLNKYSRLPEVREKLIASIINQNSPVVLSNLAEAIAAGGQSLDPTEFKTRLNKELPPQIIRSMEEAVIQL